MKNVLQKITCLMISFMAVGCAQPGGSSPAGKSSNQSSSQKTSSSAPHEHTWDTNWSYDETNHWHKCRSATCEEVSDLAPHELGQWENTTPDELTGADKYAYVNPKIRRCSCGYYELSGTNILPELRFNFKDTDASGQPQEVNFATIAKKNDVSRPEVVGTFSLKNCQDKTMEFEGETGTMKVRGNQTAGWRKKGFRIKFDNKRGMLGLNNGGEFKKWVLLADAKDTTLIRTAMGLYISKQICQEDNQIWVCECTPVTVYLNDQYWGYYYLGEQKEVKEDDNGNKRIRLKEPAKKYKGIDIGYCFELDHYADGAGASDDASEFAKGADGDPTFRMKYLPALEQGHPSGPLATGQVYTYTMLSDITDGPTDTHVQADYSRVSGGAPDANATKTSNSNQLTFIRDRMEALYQILYHAAMNNAAKEINEAGEIVASTKSVEEVISQYFDVNAWVDGFIISAFVVPPDLGYSSFYMSYDNTSTGDKKLRFDCPWDFDSNFGNRLNFYVNAQTDTYVENTYNTWLYLFNKLSFFIDLVKAKWNSLRESQAFEGMFHMVNQYWTNYDAEIKRNHYRWPENDASKVANNGNPSYYNNFNELRDPFKEPSQYKQAETETLNWCAKRINFLETKWGTGRPNISTNQ